jgi:hypothetical protein
MAITGRNVFSTSNKGQETGTPDSRTVFLLIMKDLQEPHNLIPVKGCRIIIRYPKGIRRSGEIMDARKGSSIQVKEPSGKDSLRAKFSQTGLCARNKFKMKGEPQVRINSGRNAGRKEPFNLAMPRYKGVKMFRGQGKKHVHPITAGG